MIESEPRRCMELLAPAGSPDCLAAAVAGGADAVYLGLRRFSARGRAANFTHAQLATWLPWLHGHGLRAYLVLNTLLDDASLDAAVADARRARQAGIDAVIVQDPGLWLRLAREVPELPRHASTQMTVHDPRQVIAWVRDGARRLILARELDLTEIAACAAAAATHGAEVECFVHGALCYAYSGQCLAASVASGRSANRGVCAQNCRYRFTDEHGHPCRALSLRDLDALDYLPALAAAGVTACKIEGRLKSPAYVYTVCRVYRAALDALAIGEWIDVAAARHRLRAVFSRPTTAGYLAGSDASPMREDDGDEEADAVLVAYDRHRREADLRAATPITAGHGFRYRIGDWTGGFLITAARPCGDGRWRCRVRHDERGPAWPIGLALIRNLDQAVLDEARTAIARHPLPPVIAPTVPLQLDCAGRCGDPLRCTARSDDGRVATVTSDELLQPARGRPLDQASLARGLGSLGGSGYHAAAIILTGLDDGVFLPLAALKRLRRQLVAALDALPVPEEERLAGQMPTAHAEMARDTGLVVAVGGIEAGRAALAAGADAVWLDGAHAATAAPPAEEPQRWWWRYPAGVSTPTTFPTGGAGVVAGHRGILAAATAAGLATVVDASMHALNRAAVHLFCEAGAAAVCLGLECRRADVLAAALPPTMPILVPIYGRPAVMVARQPSGLNPGRRRRLVASQREEGWICTLEAGPAGGSVVRDARVWFAAEDAAHLRGRVDGLVCELETDPPDAVAGQVAAWRRFLDGGSVADLRRACAPFATNGFIAPRYRAPGTATDASDASPS